MVLTSKQRAALKSLAHPLRPVVTVGQRGVTDAVVEETERALLAHELIKVKMPAGKERTEQAEELASRAGAELVAVRGRNAILYRPYPDEPRIRLPKS